MKRLVSLILISIAAGYTAFAQQDPLSTMFMTNPFVLNPAIAGTNKYFQVMSSNRFQWVGLADAPITNSLSVYGPLVNHPMGWGASIYYDVYGPVSTGTIHGSYAYQYNINEEMNISAGLNLGVMQYKIDYAKIEMPDEGDPTMNAKESYYIPDANVGFYFWSSTYHAGLVFRHILNNRISINSSTSRDSSSRLKPHIYLTGGYKYYINRDWAIEPSLVLKKVWPAPFQLDINCRVWYQNKIWGGLAYRTQEALSIMLGYTYDRKIYIGYSYDLVLNALGAHNYGSHEIVLGYRFNDIKD
jgi:type IX secretion system PorP/SprF family membrane protein